MNSSTTPVDLRLWRQFLAVAEELNFGRAAQKLYMSQPPLTQAIARLEGLIEAKLFFRTSHKVVLTPVGEALRPVVEDLLRRADELFELAQSMGVGAIGTLRLAFVSPAGFELIPRWTTGFRSLNPSVNLELTESVWDAQLLALDKSNIDLACMLHARGMPPQGYEYLTVATEPLVLAMASTHPLSQAAPVEVAAVLAESLIIFPRRIAPSLYDAVLAIYSSHKCSPTIAQEAIQMQTIVNLVAAGLGVAWVPKSLCAFQRPGVSYYELDIGPSAACEMSLVWKQARAMPVLEAFIRFASQ